MALNIFFPTIWNLLSKLNDFIIDVAFQLFDNDTTDGNKKPKQASAITE